MERKHCWMLIDMMIQILYAQVEKSPFWGIMHDGITKFQKEYHGCFLRILDQDNSPVAAPYGLTNVPGSVTDLQVTIMVLELIASHPINL